MNSPRLFRPEERDRRRVEGWRQGQAARQGQPLGWRVDLLREEFFPRQTFEPHQGQLEMGKEFAWVPVVRSVLVALVVDVAVVVECRRTAVVSERTAGWETMM